MTEDSADAADVPVIVPMAHECPVSRELEHRINVWITDNGVASHMTFSRDGMEKLKEDSTGVVIVNGCYLRGTYQCDLDIYPLSKQCIFLPKITLTIVLYLPSLSYNLFRINSALNKNKKLTASGKDGYMINNDKEWLFFECKIETSDSYLFASFMQQVGAAALLATQAGCNVMANDVHKKLGHCLEALTCKAAQYYDWKLTHGGMPTCKDCATGKGHQKDVVKDSEHVSLEVLGDRICADITSMKTMNTRVTASCFGSLLLIYTAT